MKNIYLSLAWVVALCDLFYHYLVFGIEMSGLVDWHSCQQRTRLYGKVYRAVGWVDSPVFGTGRKADCSLLLGGIGAFGNTAETFIVVDVKIFVAINE